MKCVITAEFEEEYSKGKTERDIEENIYEKLLQELLPICCSLKVNANLGKGITKRPEVKNIVKNPNGSLDIFFKDKDLLPINVEEVGCIKFERKSTVEDIKDTIAGKLIDRLNSYKKQYQRTDGSINKPKIRNKIKELEKCIQIVQSV